MIKQDGCYIKIMLVERGGGANSTLYSNSFDMESAGQVHLAAKAVQELGDMPQRRSKHRMFTTGKTYKRYCK